MGTVWSGWHRIEQFGRLQNKIILVSPPLVGAHIRYDLGPKDLRPPIEIKPNNDHEPCKSKNKTQLQECAFTTPPINAISGMGKVATSWNSNKRKLSCEVLSPIYCFPYLFYSPKLLSAPAPASPCFCCHRFFS